MKHQLSWSLLMTLGITCSAQKVNTVLCDNYVTQAFKGVFIEMPDYREVNSGSKLVVTYEGEWPAEMQGAFEYAVKIWEEVLPMTLPINVTAKIGNLRGSGNLLPRVTNDNGPPARLRENNLDKLEAYISQAYLVKTSAVRVRSAYSSRPVSKCDVITRMAVGDGQSAQTIAKAPSGNGSASVALPMDNPDNVVIPGYVRLGEALCVKSDVAIKSISVYDISGKILSRVSPDDGVVALPLTGLNISGRGIYILTVTTEKSTVSGKIPVK